MGEVLDLDWREAVRTPEFDRQIRVHLVRTRFVDEKLVKALKSGVTQVVIMGAGFDSRAYRFRWLFPGVRYIEVDYGPTQEYKKRRVVELFGSIPDNITYAPIDLNKEKLGEVLSRAGYRPAERSFFIWEGVAYYLHESAVVDTLRFVATTATSGTTIAMDFVYQFLIDKIDSGADPADLPAVRSVLGLAKRLAESGEPCVSGIPENGERGYLAKIGLDLSRFCLRVH